MGALSDILAWGGIVLLVVGAFALTIAGASIRVRPTLAVVALILSVAGFLLPRRLDDAPLMMSLQIASAVLILSYMAVLLWRLFHLPKPSKPRRDVHA